MRVMGTSIGIRPREPDDGRAGTGRQAEAVPPEAMDPTRRSVNPITMPKPIHNLKRLFEMRIITSSDQ
jgi:hypothetical protein